MKTKLVLLAVFLCFILIFGFYNVYSSTSPKKNDMSSPMIILLDENNDEGTLTVTGIHELYEGVSWGDLEIIGKATIPSGTIKIGDTITNCDGTVNITYVHGSGSLWIGVHYFKDLSNEFGKFIGEWKVSNETYTWSFFSNRSFYRKQSYSPSIWGTWDLHYSKFSFGLGTVIIFDYQDYGVTTHRYFFNDDYTSFKLTNMNTETTYIFTKQ